MKWGFTLSNAKIKKTPMRTCIITHEKLPKKDLLRIVRTPEGDVIIDQKGKANGRGAYLKKEETVFNKAQRSKILTKHLGVSVPDSIFQQLHDIIKDEK